jgi:hypothetical protein
MDKIATLSSDKEQLEHLVLRLQVRLIDCLIQVMRLQVRLINCLIPVMERVSFL